MQHARTRATVQFQRDRSATYQRVVEYVLDSFASFVSLKTPADQITPSFWERRGQSHRRLVASRPIGTSFRTPRGLRRNTVRVARRLRRLAQRLGCPRETAHHAFQHMFVTRHLDRGVPITRRPVDWRYCHHRGKGVLARHPLRQQAEVRQT